MLRPLKLNDNLNNMTLFFTFPNDFYKTDGETLFTTNNNNQIYSIYSNNIYRIYSNFNNNLVKLYEITRDNLNDGNGANININELKLDDIDDIIVELNSNVSFNNYINIDDGKAKYTIIIDKQPRNNPSSDKKEITLILEHPLLKRGDINDELTIQNGKCIISRKLELTNDNNIKVLDEPYEEIIENINLDLFLGDNYIYILEENYMPLYIKYLTHNDLNTAYATKLELTSSITQTSTNIMLEVSKKTDKEEIISTINQSAEEIQIQANKISLIGKEMNLTSDNIEIASNNFNVDKYGNMECNNGTFNGTINGSTINGGKITLNDEGQRGSSKLTVTGTDGIIERDYINEVRSSRIAMGRTNTGSGEGEECSLGIYYTMITPDTHIQGALFLRSDTGYETSVWATGIITPSIQQTSKAEMKKNFELLEDGISIIKDIDIYKYNFKQDSDDTKKHIGFVIGNNFNYRKEITSQNNDGVDLYSMISVAYKAIQELSDKIEELENKIEKMESDYNA